MALYNFYEIKSQKSTQYHEGVRQVSLACEGDGGIQLFFWVTAEEEVKHLQFLFDEQMLEWSPTQGLITSVTNRRGVLPLKQGWQKGSRTLIASQDPEILQRGRRIIEESSIPSPYGELLRKVFTASQD